MSETTPLQPAYGLTKKIAIGVTSTKVDLSDWNLLAKGYTQVLITNRALDMTFICFSSTGKDAEKDKDLPIIPSSAITITRSQADNTFAIIGDAAGGFMWITPVVGD